MEESNTVASEYREIIRELAFRHKGANWEDLFYSFLEEHWKNDLLRFNILQIKNDYVDKSDDFRVRMFLFAVGLMTYGRKDVIPFVLQNMREIGKINHHSLIVLKLLPLPEELKNLDKKTEILDWVNINYEALTWDEKKEVFYLRKV